MRKSKFLLIFCSRIFCDEDSFPVSTQFCATPHPSSYAHCEEEICKRPKLSFDRVSPPVSWSHCPFCMPVSLGTNRPTTIYATPTRKDWRYFCPEYRSITFQGMPDRTAQPFACSDWLLFGCMHTGIPGRYSMKLIENSPCVYLVAVAVQSVNWIKTTISWLIMLLMQATRTYNGTWPEKYKIGETLVSSKQL